MEKKTEAEQEPDANNLKPGDLVPGEGIYLCTYMPRDNKNRPLLRQIFDVYVAPTDLKANVRKGRSPEPNHHALLYICSSPTPLRVNILNDSSEFDSSKLTYDEKNYTSYSLDELTDLELKFHGREFARSIRDFDDFVESVKCKDYEDLGKWFLPPLDILHDEGHKFSIRDNMFAHRNHGSFKGTFNQESGCYFERQAGKYHTLYLSNSFNKRKYSVNNKEIEWSLRAVFFVGEEDTKSLKVGDTEDVLSVSARFVRMVPRGEAPFPHCGYNPMQG